VQIAKLLTWPKGQSVCALPTAVVEQSRRVNTWRSHSDRYSLTMVNYTIAAYFQNITFWQRPFMAWPSVASV